MNLQGLKLSKNKRRDMLIKRMIGKYIQNQKQLSLQNGSFQYYEGPKLFQKQAQIKLECLLLSRNYKPDILNDICHISFPFLTKLHLSQNNIQSVQLLTKLDSPFLAHLDLSQNRIYTSRLFRKFPMILKGLSIHGNHLRELLGFSEISFEKQISELSLQEYCGQKSICEDLRVILKSPIRKAQHLFTRNKIAQFYQVNKLIQQKIHIKYKR